MWHNEKKHRCRCIICGKWFVSARPESLYDTSACKKQAYRKRKISKNKKGISQMDPIVMANTQNMPREQWLELRKQGIGGSDVGGIINAEGAYHSAREIYYQKIGELLPEESSEAAKIGLIMEPVIRTLFEDATGLKTKRYKYIVKHPLHSFMFANVDDLVEGEEIGVEYKNVDVSKSYLWAEDNVPDCYYCQCQHYMQVMGFNSWWIAALIGGNHFIYKLIPRNESFIQEMVNAEKTFWQCVENRMPPAGDMSYDVVKKLYPNSNGLTIQLPDVAEEIAQKYEFEKAFLDEKEKEVEQLKVQLYGLVGNNYRGKTPSFEVGKSKISPKPKFDVEAFKTANPELYEKFLKPSDPYYKFYFKRVKE